MVTAGSVVSATPAAVRSLPRLPPPVPPPRHHRLLSYSFSCSDLTTKTRLPDKKGSESGSGLDSNSAGSDYLSFHGSDCDEGDGKGDEDEEEERVVHGEREQRMILEDAGLILRVGGDDVRVKSLDKEMGCERSASGEAGLKEVLETTIGLGDDDEDGKEKKKEEEKRRRRRRRSLPAVPVGPRALSLTRGQQSQVAVSDIDPSDESSIVDSDSTVSTMPQNRRRLKRMVSNAISAKDLPPIPSCDDDEDGEDDINRRISKLSTSSSWSSSSSPPTLTISKRTFDPDEHAKRLDDAFERYESFKKAHLAANYNNNRLSVISATSADSNLVYPPLSPTMPGASVMTPTSSKEFELGNLPHQQHPRPHRHHRFSANLSALPYGLHSHISQGKSEESPTGMSPPGGSRYSQLLQFLSIGRAKTPEHESGAGRKVTISGPMAVNNMSGEGDGSLDGGNARSDSPAFGSVSGEVLFVENHVSDLLGVVLGQFS